MKRGNADNCKKPNGDHHLNDINTKKGRYGWDKWSSSGPENRNVQKSKGKHGRLESSMGSNMDTNIGKKNNRGWDSWDISSYQGKGQRQPLDSTDGWGKSRFPGPEKDNSQIVTSISKKPESSKWPDAGIGNKHSSMSSNWDRFLKDSEVHETADGWGERVTTDNHSNGWGTAFDASRGWYKSRSPGLEILRRQTSDTFPRPESSKGPHTRISKKDGSMSSNWDRPLKDSEVQETADGWGKQVTPDYHGNGRGTAFDASRGWDRSRSLGLKTLRWQTPDTSLGPDWRGRHRSRSRSPLHGLKHGLETRDKKGGIRARGSTVPCRSFAAGSCRFGGQCRFLHEEGSQRQSARHYDSKSEPWESRLEMERYLGAENKEGFKDLLEMDQRSIQKRSRGSIYRFVHEEDASDGGQPNRNKTRERNSDRRDSDAAFTQGHDSQRDSGTNKSKFFAESRSDSEGRLHHDRWGPDQENNDSSAWNGWKSGDQTSTMDKPISSQWMQAAIDATKNTSRSVDGGCTQKTQHSQSQNSKQILQQESLVTTLQFQEQTTSQEGYGKHEHVPASSVQMIAESTGIKQNAGTERETCKIESTVIKDSPLYPAMQIEKHGDLGWQNHQMISQHCEVDRGESLEVRDGTPIPQNRLTFEQIAQIKDLSSSLSQINQVLLQLWLSTPIIQEVITSEQVAQIKMLSESFEQISQQHPLPSSAIPDNKEVITTEEIKNLSASLEKISQHLPQLCATFNPNGGVISSLPQPSSNTSFLRPISHPAAPTIQPSQVSSSQQRFRPVSASNSPEPVTSESSTIPPGVGLLAAGKNDYAPQKSQKNFNSLIPSPAIEKLNNGNSKRNADLEEKQDGNEEFKQVETAGKDVSEIKSGSAQGEQGGAHIQDVFADHQTDGESKSSENKGKQMFKLAVAEYVKDQLKPTWEEGHLSKEAHKTIVKRVVEKVLSVMPAPSIPQTAEHIDHYMTYSKIKLSKLIQAYLEKFVQM